MLYCDDVFLSDLIHLELIRLISFSKQLQWMKTDAFKLKKDTKAPYMYHNSDPLTQGFMQRLIFTIRSLAHWEPNNWNRSMVLWTVLAESLNGSQL